VSTGGAARRPRPRSLRSGAFFVLVGVVVAPGAGPLAAQEPDTIPEAPPDTLRPVAPDTLPRPLPVDSLVLEAAGQDTVAQDTVPQDTLPPPPDTLPTLWRVGRPGWDRGVWEWDRNALLRLPDLSLLQLLERVPGVVPIRVDIVGQAESGSVFGATAGAIRYVLDGFVLDPLVSPTFDPSRFPLLALERVRVERRVGGATVHLETVGPDDPRSESVIEAATGDYGVNLFRGTFLAPRLLGGALGLGFERLAADGFVGSSNHTATWLKWRWVRDAGGVQVELKQSDMDRSGVDDGLAGSRTDWAVRARGALGPVTGEVFAGGSSMEDDRGDVVLREGTPHGGLRLRGDWAAPIPIDFSAAVRFRDHPRLPSREAELGIRMVPIPAVSLEAEAVQGWWSDGDPTGRWEGRAVLGPVLGFSAFAEVSRGGAILGEGPGLRMPATVESAPPFRVSRDGLRSGAQWTWRGLVLGAAAIRTSTDAVHPFGLRPERGWGPTGATGEVTGMEATARVPIPRAPFALEGWYVELDRPTGWLYTPDRQWQAALVYHHLPLPSGNLEIYTRVEHVYRGPMTAPGASEDGGTLELLDVAPYRSTNAELVIRVHSLRAFLRWSNMRNRPGLVDLPGYGLPGQHILYGVKWEFWN
jgi:hypothetical protein